MSKEGEVPSSSIVASAAAYERWMRATLGDGFDEAALALKHQAMAQSPFLFLRATYWRFAETVPNLCPELMDAPPVLGVGDIHIENFGSWLDGEGRLVWGVNDFDEAANFPWTLDLVRLAASLLLAQDGSDRARELTEPLIKGYREGLGAPRPTVLEHENDWLREAIAVSDGQRERFWKKLGELLEAEPPAPVRALLARTMPEPDLALRVSPRTAGTGSLGRARWIAVATWRGGPVVREVKAMLPSAWTLAHGKTPPNGGTRLLVDGIATGRYRAPDPYYRLEGRWLARRLSAVNRKIDVTRNEAKLFGKKGLIHAMGRDLAAIHAASEGAPEAIARDLDARPESWLADSASRVAAALILEHTAWKKHLDK